MRIYSHELSNTAKQNGESKMSKFTTEQIKAAVKELYARNDAEVNAAYRMAFDELESRLGGDAIDAWLDTWM